MMKTYSRFFPLSIFILSVLFTVVTSCKPAGGGVAKMPAERRIIISYCWQTFDMGLKDKAAFVQTHTMRLLGRIGTRRALETLSNADLKGKPTLVRMYVNTLARQNDSLAFTLLVPFMKSSDFQTRATAVTGLAKMGALYADTTVVAMFRKALSDVDSVRVDSFLLDSVEVATERLDLRSRLGIALLKYRDRSGTDYIRKASNHPSMQVRLAVVNTLGEIRPPDALAMLKPFLKDPSDYVRLKTIDALAKISEMDSETILRNLLTAASSDAMKTRAALGLLKKDEKASLPVLIAAVSDYDEDTRSKVLLALGDVRLEESRERVLPVLREQLNDPVVWIRVAAIGSLGKLKDTAAIPLIEKIYQEDGTQDVKEIALAVLSELKGKVMTDHLLKKLEDDEYSMRAAAVSALGRIRDASLEEKVILPALYNRMVKDNDMMVRLWAAFAILDILHEHKYTLNQESN